MSVGMCVLMHAHVCLHVCVQHKKSRHFSPRESTGVTGLNHFQYWSPGCSCVLEACLFFSLTSAWILVFISGLAPCRNEMDVGKKSQFQNCCFAYSILIAFADMDQI